MDPGGTGFVDSAALRAALANFQIDFTDSQVSSGPQINIPALGDLSELVR